MFRLIASFVPHFLNISKFTTSVSSFHKNNFTKFIIYIIRNNARYITLHIIYQPLKIAYKYILTTHKTIITHTISLHLCKYSYYITNLSHIYDFPISHNELIRSTGNIFANVDALTPFDIKCQQHVRFVVVYFNAMAMAIDVGTYLSVVGYCIQNNYSIFSNGYPY